jgi:hypothetical protein
VRRPDRRIPAETERLTLEYGNARFVHMIRKAQPPLGIVLPLVAILIPSIGHAADAHPEKLTTYWLGTTQAGCGALVTNPMRCNAVQNIGLTLI